ncbi:hypothetical protein ACJO2E_08515 [Marinobacter sp. M1N3S26]|uniref:hypothetical protein n=1 Tax=Marinobacter sp. M1N3S26 TaxID=3382299 RepID=UPI00387AD537
MLTINAPVFDIDGHLTVENPVEDGVASFTRRVSRVATLDGAAAINDFGYSAADRTLNIEWTPRSLLEEDLARRLVQSYGRLIVTFREGCFVGAPFSFDLQEGVVTVVILVERKLSA